MASIKCCIWIGMATKNMIDYWIWLIWLPNYPNWLHWPENWIEPLKSNETVSQPISSAEKRLSQVVRSVRNRTEEPSKVWAVQIIPRPINPVRRSPPNEPYIPYAVRPARPYIPATVGKTRTEFVSTSHACKSSTSTIVQGTNYRIPKIQRPIDPKPPTEEELRAAL